MSYAHVIWHKRHILYVSNRLEWTNSLDRRALCCGEMSGEWNFSRASICWLLVTEYPLTAYASYVYQLDKTWTPTFLTAFCSTVNSTDNTTNGSIALRLFIAFREYTRRNVKKNYIFTNVSLIIIIIVLVLKQIFIIGHRFINYGSALLSLKLCNRTVCIISVGCRLYY